MTSVTSGSISGRQPQAVRSALAILEEVAAAGVGREAVAFGSGAILPHRRAPAALAPPPTLGP